MGQQVEWLNDTLTKLWPYIDQVCARLILQHDPGLFLVWKYSLLASVVCNRICLLWTSIFPNSPLNFSDQLNPLLCIVSLAYHRQLQAWSKRRFSLFWTNMLWESFRSSSSSRLHSATKLRKLQVLPCFSILYTSFSCLYWEKHLHFICFVRWNCYPIRDVVVHIMRSRCNSSPYSVLTG